VSRAPAVAGGGHRADVYDWDAHGEPAAAVVEVGFVDETLRDGLQSPSVRQPTVAEKAELVRRSAGIGTRAVNVGFPGASPVALRDAQALTETIRDGGLEVTPQCAARTRDEDLQPIVEIARRTGVRLEVGLFVGQSPLRRAAEGWGLDHVLALVERALEVAVAAGLDVLFVTEDTTRSRPEDLERLYGLAVRRGARRVCIADTAGYATPRAAAALTRFVRSVCDASGGGEVGIDWHGHNDRGLAVAAALASAAAGASRVHGTALGVGERVGNAALEQLMVNAAILGWSSPALAELPGYLSAAADALGIQVPPWAPVAGRDAFSTASGVHAAALLKARRQGDVELLDLVYSAVPAAWLGRHQRVDVGPYSGAANVEYWLASHDYPSGRELVKAILAVAKAADSSLDDEVLHDLARCAARAPVAP